MAGHSFPGLRFGDTVTAIGRVDAFQRIEWDVNSIRMVRPSIQQGDQVRWRVASDPAGCHAMFSRSTRMASPCGAGFRSAGNGPA